MAKDLHPVARNESWLCGVCGSLMEILPCKPTDAMLQHRCNRCNVVVQAQRTVGMLKVLPARAVEPGASA